MSEAALTLSTAPSWSENQYTFSAYSRGQPKNEHHTSFRNSGANCRKFNENDIPQHGLCVVSDVYDADPRFVIEIHDFMFDSIFLD